SHPSTPKRCCAWPRWWPVTTRFCGATCSCPLPTSEPSIGPTSRLSDRALCRSGGISSGPPRFMNSASTSISSARWWPRNAAGTSGWTSSAGGLRARASHPSTRLHNIQQGFARRRRVIEVMSALREIFVKAVCARGKRGFVRTHRFRTKYHPDDLLGCRVTNHRVAAVLTGGGGVAVQGSYDIHLW